MPYCLKWPPPPILGQGEPPQGVRLYHAPFFQIFKGCHITLKSLILIIFYLPVNYLFLPLLDDIKKAYRTNLQTEKTTLTQKPSNMKRYQYHTIFYFVFWLVPIHILYHGDDSATIRIYQSLKIRFFGKRRNIVKNYVYFVKRLSFFRNFLL